NCARPCEAGGEGRATAPHFSNNRQPTTDNIAMKLPKGFLASGVRAGIRKKRPDLGLIVAEDGANAAAVFTKKRFQAAPVVLSNAALKKSAGRVKGVVVNAGCANAVTGTEGTNAAKRVRMRAAELLRCNE